MGAWNSTMLFVQRSGLDPAQAPAREELLRRAQALVPVLRERAEDAETLRQCPDATIRDYVDNGLLRICQPSRYGGYDLGYDVLCEVTQTLAERLRLAGLGAYGFGRQPTEAFSLHAAGAGRRLG
jgi:alkylation response protein AidB-like acyl-CoA dehydrogenase